MTHSENVDQHSAQFDGVSTCDQEPIHAPGAIQPQGALLVARKSDLGVTHVSANIADFLGLAPQEVWGRSLPQLLGEGGRQCLASLSAGAGSGSPQVFVGEAPTAEFRLQMTGHIMGDFVGMELEAALPSANEGAAIQHAQMIMHALHAASGQRELCEIVVTKLRELTGYDRVMLYRFDREGHGEVIAEDRAADVGSYLGLRFPASDIPQQARRAYLAQRVRSIADTEYLPVPVLSDPKLGPCPPLDMTLCGLRSVSPVHLEYMRNMGTRASLGLSLIPSTSLWGLLICHHRCPLVIAADVRAQCGLIGQLTSLLLASMGDREAYAELLRRQRIVQSVVGRVGETEQVADGLYASGEALLAMVEADGALIRLGGRSFTLGHVPSMDAALRAMEELKSASGESLVAVDELQECLADWSAQSAVASGALLLPLRPNSDDAIVWFRPEKPRVINWGGDPGKPTAADPTTGRLSPRHSFEAWSEQVRGHSHAVARRRSSRGAGAAASPRRGDRTTGRGRTGQAALLRCAHRPAQPADVSGAPEWSGSGGRRSPSVSRSGPLQGRKRHPGPRGR